MHSPRSTTDSIGQEVRTDTALEVRPHRKGSIGALKEFYLRRLSQSDAARSLRTSSFSPRTRTRDSEVESERSYPKDGGWRSLEKLDGGLSKVVPRIEMLNAKLTSMRAALETRILDGNCQNNALRHLTQLRYHVESALKWSPGLGAQICEHTIEQVKQLTGIARVLGAAIYVFSKRTENIILQKERALRKTEANHAAQTPSYQRSMSMDLLKGEIQFLSTSRTTKAESTVVSDLDSECGTMYADTIVTWDGPSNDVGNMQEINDVFALKGEDEQRRWFYSQCLSAKMATNDPIRARKVLISDLYSQVKASKIPTNKWASFIQEQLMAPGHKDGG
ncbi:unnamed protein product [Effrenium voratum]|uniref:Uncharacterized protein n=1 Tax=Effrenium voratum TaxID=2562239 RepID=A0AA36MW74_9DINO|nr:unnamed protein product [Effrenium voratum]CAJ1431979.1 unnamed protein product [Effrenium voratum]